MFVTILMVTMFSVWFSPITSDNYWYYHMLGFIALPFGVYPCLLYFTRMVVTAPKFMWEGRVVATKLAFFLSVAFSLVASFYNELVVDIQEHGPNAAVQWNHVIADCLGVLIFVFLVQYVVGGKDKLTHKGRTGY